MPAAHKRKTISVERVSVLKSYDVLANRLRDSILRREIAEGEPLPTERELVTQTGLSRGSVREALRILAVEGLLRTTHGRLGGNIVTLPGNESMATAIDRFVRGRRLPLRALQETREILEPSLARLAAERCTSAGLEEIQSLHHALITAAGDFEKFSQLNIKWHNAIARASGNELLAAVLFSVSYGVAVATTVKEYDTAETRAQVIHIHGLINQAIESRNPDLAERRMRQHIQATRAITSGTEEMNIPLSDEVDESSSA